MDSYSKIADEIRELAEIYGGESPQFYGQVPDDCLLAAEEELGTPFPHSYRAFLKHYGAACMMGYAFDGITDDIVTDPTSSPNFLQVVGTTKSLWGGAMSRSLIYLTSDGGDYMYFLDSGQGRDGEYPVVVCDPGAEEVKVADSFIEFLRKLSKREDLF